MVFSRRRVSCNAAWFRSKNKSFTGWMALAAGICFALALTPCLVLAGLSPEPTGTGESDMVFIADGVFTKGSTEEDIDWIVKAFRSESREWYMDETPAQKVYLEAYYIDKNPVTVAQYRKFMQATGTTGPKYLDNPKFNGPDQPIVGVTWQEASNYCGWVGKRLPTEEEWEKAARGYDARRYPWGNDLDVTKANVRGKKDKYHYTSPVGRFPQGKSPYGVMDMAGNVWEWTLNWYLPYEGNQHKNDMYGETLKVTRGGSWKANMDLARSALRGKAIPDHRLNYIGFRCVKQP